MIKKLLTLLIIVSGMLPVTAQVLTESFDGVGFPPTGWTNTLISAGDGSQGFPGGLWNRTTAGTNPTATPHSGAGMAMYNSYDFDPTSQADLITPAMNFAGIAKRVSFWMYRSATYTNQDSITVYVNTTNSATGGTYLGKIIRYINAAPIVASIGWYQYYFDIPGSYNGPTNYIIFRATGEYGLNMFIDDIIVGDQPSCFTPSALIANNYNYVAGTATATWTAATGSPVGYEWAINTTGTAPASGTAVPGTTASLTGITSDVVNYFFVRTDCGGGNFSAWISTSFAALPCATIVAPINGATDVPQNQVFSWNAVTGATSYNFYLGLTAGTEISIGNLATLSTPVTNLTPSTTYYWYIVPSIGSVAALNSCTSNSFTIAVEANTPANNACSGAVLINTSNTSGNPIAGTTAGASLSLPANSCVGFTGTADDDVWYQFVTSSSAPAGTLTITPDVAGGIIDIVAQVYAANSCGALGNPVACADATSGATAEVVDLSTLSPSTHYYMRIYSYSGAPANQGAFTIVASAGNTLPVTLTTFTVQRIGKINKLNWSTSQELNTSQYIVERSSDDRNYIAIGKIDAAGNSSSTQNYTFNDNFPIKGINFYRLKIVDKDNDHKYSPVRNVRNETISNISIYPNPVRDMLNINLPAEKAASAQMIITDISGTVVYRKAYNLLPGNNNLKVNVSNISSGAYFIKIQLPDNVQVSKFNKQ